MSELGFTHLKSDAGIFVYKKGNDVVIIVIYVDDALFYGKNKVLIVYLHTQFMKKWECRDLGDAQEFLRMHIHREGGAILLDQCPYLETVVDCCGMTNAKPVPTPLSTGYQALPNTEAVDPILRQRFQTVIGSLLYLMLGTCPDISFAVTTLAQQSANPSKDHLAKALYICRYLLGTKSYALKYDGSSMKGLVACTDSDWASNPSDRRSQTGFFLKLANGIFSWTSHAQKTVALSSTEAEYMALSDCNRQVVWVLTLLEEIGYKFRPIPICGDNQGALFMASNPITEKRSKHIDIRYHYVREVIAAKKVEVFYIDGNDNPADMFMKNLGHVKFLKFRSLLGLEFY